MSAPRDCREDDMRPPFKLDNVSSSSLEGMERPVRSFKSFIETVPPHPKPAEKPLPAIPSPGTEARSIETQTLPISTDISSPASPSSSTSISSWSAPADWYNCDSSAQSPCFAPPSPTARGYSLLISDPLAHGFPDMVTTADTWPGYSSCATSRLLPIYERPANRADLSPPRRPPRSPLPAILLQSGKSLEKSCTVERYSWASSPDMLESKRFAESELRLHTVSPANSTNISITSSGSTKEKALVSSDISSPGTNPVVLEDTPYHADDIPLIERTRADRQYLQGKKLRALNKGSPFADDSWEDANMDDKTRQLSFSQDYHDLLADQYQGLVVRAEEVLSSGGARKDYTARFERPGPRPKVPPKDYHLVPRPLSWQKGSAVSTPRIAPQTTVTERSTSSTPEQRKHRKITSWVSRHLSASQMRQLTKRQSGERPKSAALRPRQKQIPEAEVDKVLEQDLCFSMLFTRSKPMRFGKKQKQDPAALPTKASPVAVSPPRNASRLMHLPGGLVVVRHSPSSVPQSQSASVRNISPASDHAPGDSCIDSEDSPTFYSDHRSSYNSRASESPVAPGTAIHGALRASCRSSFSGSSGQLSPSHPLSQEVPRSPHSPPLPPLIPSSSHSPPLSPNAWKRLKSHHWKNNTGDKDHHFFKAGLIEKAKEARRKHGRELRQDKLKKSIRVLGPTDPGVVAGYVKREVIQISAVKGDESRLPGYMASGPV